MPRIEDITVATSWTVGEFMIVETTSGTRIITKADSWVRRSEVTALTADALSLDSDRVLLFDASDDGRLKAVSVRDIVYGNLQNESETEDFTLDPLLHIRPVQCTGSFTNGIVTLDGNAAIGGCTFTLGNFTDADLTVTAINGVEMRVDGVAGDGVIRQNRIAAIMVLNGGTTAIFEGG